MPLEFEFIASLPSGAVYWVYVRGTIQEVLNSLQNHNISSDNVRWWSDDGVNAECIFCRRS